MSGLSSDGETDVRTLGKVAGLHGSKHQKLFAAQLPPRTQHVLRTRRVALHRVGIRVAKIYEHRAEGRER